MHPAVPRIRIDDEWDCHPLDHIHDAVHHLLVGEEADVRTGQSRVADTSARHVDSLVSSLLYQEGAERVVRSGTDDDGTALEPAVQDAGRVFHDASISLSELLVVLFASAETYSLRYRSSSASISGR